MLTFRLGSGFGIDSFVLYRIQFIHLNSDSISQDIIAQLQNENIEAGIVIDGYRFFHLGNWCNMDSTSVVCERLKFLPFAFIIIYTYGVTLMFIYWVSLC